MKIERLLVSGFDFATGRDKNVEKSIDEIKSLHFLLERNCVLKALKLLSAFNTSKQYHDKEIFLLMNLD